MEGVDGSGIEVEVIGIRPRGVVVRILGCPAPQAARHMKEIRNANLGTGIVRTLPLRDGRRLPEIVDTLLDQDAHQCGGHALAHRPTFEWRVDPGSLSGLLARGNAPPPGGESGPNGKAQGLNSSTSKTSNASSSL